MNDIQLFKYPFLDNAQLKTLFVILLILIMYDFISTYVCITYFKDLVEGNPLMKYMSFPTFLCVKLALTFMGLQLLIIMSEMKPNTVTSAFIILIILYTIIFINNTYRLIGGIYERQ